MERKKLTDNEKMEETLLAYLADLNKANPITLSGLLGLQLHFCDCQSGELVLQVKPEKWMTNSGGVLHGGITATLFDMTLGLLCRCYADARACPTIHLDVNYLLPVPADQLLCIKAHLLRLGNPVCTAEGWIYLSDRPQRILAQANGSFFASGSATKGVSVS